MYWRRWLGPRLEQALVEAPVVAILGPRQVGKTTLAQERLGDRFRYATLDDPTVAGAAAADPVGFLSAGGEPLIVDEAQRAPELFPALKLRVDQDRRPGRFVILGSAHFLLMRRVTESLAGRVTILELGGLTLGERHGLEPSALWHELLSAPSLAEVELPAAAPPHEPLLEATQRGGLPPAALDDDPARRDRWLDGYVRTYLERDLRDLSQVASLADFRRLLAMLALRTAQVLNVSDLARDAGLSVTTVRHYLGLLETSFLVRRLPPLHANLGKRLTKAPKLHVRDAALAWHLSGVAVGEPRRHHALRPSFAESWLVEELLAQLRLLDRPLQFTYFRTHGGGEVDLVVEAGERLLPIEIKSAARVRPAELRSMHAFLADFEGRAPFGIVAYDGDETVRVSPRVALVPWRSLVGAVSA